jgi:exportin-1
MAQAAQSMDVLGNTDNIKILSNVLKTNVSACTSIGSFYLPQIGRIFLDMLGLYKAVSGIISETVAREGLLTLATISLILCILIANMTGNIATKTPKVRHLRTVKKEILKLMETYIKKAEDLEAVNINFMPPLLDAILGDYNRNVAPARDAEVLNVMATITGRLGVRLVWSSLGVLADCTSAAVAHSASARHTGRRIRANVEYDQSRLFRVPGTQGWLLQASSGGQPQLLPR